MNSEERENSLLEFAFRLLPLSQSAWFKLKNLYDDVISQVISVSAF
jgi:hypothetical protein